MSILKIKDSQGNWLPIESIKGDKGDKGDTGADGADYVLTAADKIEIRNSVYEMLQTAEGSEY